MLGLGWTEMLVLGVVALIVIGPKDLPAVMQQVGKYVGQIKRLGNEFQREVNRSTGLDEVRNLRKSITEPLRKSSEEIRREFNTMSKTGKEEPSGKLKPSKEGQESVVDEIRAAANMSPAPPSTREPPAAVEPASLSVTEDSAAQEAPAMTGPVKAARRNGQKAAVSGDPAAGSDANATATAAPTARKPRAAKTAGSASKAKAKTASTKSAVAKSAPGTKARSTTRKKAEAQEPASPKTAAADVNRRPTDSGDA